MKRTVWVLALVTATALFSCQKETTEKGCVRCYGCFNTWDECPEDYNGPLTWEEYTDSLLHIHESGVTINCGLVE